MENNKRPLIFSQNVTKVNRGLVNILACSAVIILIMAVLSYVGFFEFGRTYTLILLIAGLIVCLTPKILIRFLPDDFMKYYMMISVAVFIGIIGTDKNIGVYITYALVPILSCLYFEPAFVLKSSALSYIVMIVSVYFVSANMPEVLYQGRPRMQMFVAYAAGYTMEYILVTIGLYNIVKRAEHLVAYVNYEEKEKQMLNALCVDYTAAYCCDLMNDSMELIKERSFTHSAHSRKYREDLESFSQWIKYCYANVIVKETAPDFLKTFNAQNLMERLKKEDSFTYRHRTIPNEAGMEYFETVVVRLYTDEQSFKIIMGYRPIDKIIVEEENHILRQFLLSQ